MTPIDYWKEVLSNAAEECGIELTELQLETLAAEAANGHENYGQAFYSPPWSERMSDIEDEHKRKISELERVHREKVEEMESATKRLAKLHSDERIYVKDGYWEVVR